MRRRVVVTGMGMITPVGGDAESSWRAMCEGGEESARSRTVRRGDFRHADRGRGQGFPPGRLPARRRAMARPQPHIAIRAGRGDHRRGKRGAR